MKRLILSLAAVAFLATSAMAQADIYVSPEAQKAMNERGYAVEPWTPPMTPPAQDKYCPGQKVTGHAGLRQRNTNGATVFHLAEAGTFCYRGNGDKVWARLKDRWFGAPSVFFERAWGPSSRFERGTLWSTALVKERINGQSWQSDKIWTAQVFLNPNVPQTGRRAGQLIVREGGRVTGGG